MKLLTVALSVLLATLLKEPIRRLLYGQLEPSVLKLWASPTLALMLCTGAAYVLLPRLGFANYRTQRTPNPKLLAVGALLCMVGLVPDSVAAHHLIYTIGRISSPGMGYVVGFLMLALPVIGGILVAAGTASAFRSRRATHAIPVPESPVQAAAIVVVFVALLATDFWRSAARERELAKLPWDSDSGTPEARALMAAKCVHDAGQTIFRTAEGVESILIKGSLTGGDRPFLKTGRGSHVTNMNYAFLRLGLDFIERAAPTGSEPSYTRFELRTKAEGQSESAVSKYALVLDRVTTATEEAQGVRGRRIEVRDTHTAEVLASRTEFFWEPPDKGRTGLCPELQPRQDTPMSFLSRVINPVSYGCWYKMEQRPPKETTAFIVECDRQYWDARDKIAPSRQHP